MMLEIEKQTIARSKDSFKNPNFVKRTVAKVNFNDNEVLLCQGSRITAELLNYYREENWGTR